MERRLSESVLTAGRDVIAYVLPRTTRLSYMIFAGLFERNKT